jgi:hypothetical protein
VSAVTGDARPLKRPPNWLKRPVSVSFGFGGRLASLANHKQQMQDPMTGQVGGLGCDKEFCKQLSYVCINEIRKAPLPAECVLHGVVSGPL